jgi:leucyl aminopeptidase
MLAENAAALAGPHGIEVEILDEVALKAAAFGGILGVGAGSVRPPRLVRLAWRHPDATRTIAFVGKGITFDSGGLSIKPAKAMEWMKADMAGAAAVIAAISAIARLNLPINITAWAPLAENMPSGTATRPGDVLRMYGGKTVEVLNTDAEGRLVLGDALVRAGEEKPDAIVDVATLTGAQLVALGARVSAIMTNDDDFGAEVRRAADDAGEAMWPMPLPPELRASMDTDIADIANIGDRSGGMLVAGLFLAEFVPAGTPWVHLDIAGPSYNDGKPYGYTPSGGTGVAVRTLVRLAELSAT